MQTIRWKQYVLSLSELTDKYHLVGFVAANLDEAIAESRRLYQKEFRLSQIREIGQGMLTICNCPSFREVHTKLRQDGTLPFIPGKSTNGKIFSIHYYSCTREEYEAAEDPPSSVEIDAYIDGNVEEKLTQWAADSGYTIESWEPPYSETTFVELALF